MRFAVFWGLGTVDIIAMAIITYFFVEGLGDGTISSTNALLWLGLAMIPATILASAFLLRARGRIGSLMFGLFTAILTLGPGSYR